MTNGKPISIEEALAYIRQVAVRTDPSFREA